MEVSARKEIRDGSLTYELVACATLVSEPEGHPDHGKWESKVTVYRKEPGRPAQQGKLTHLGSTAAEANEKALKEGEEIAQSPGPF